MVLVIDNYDSFTYNLVQYLGEMGKEILVFRNDKITFSQIEELWPEKIVISPGPGTPQKAGISCGVIEHFAGKISILGVCLGHQCIGEVFGGKIVRADRLMHGKTSLIQHDGKTIFRGLQNPFVATRYHSLIIERSSLPEILEISAESADEKEIMAVRHSLLPVEGVQFHPESILTPQGKVLLRNFIQFTPGG